MWPALSTHILYNFSFHVLKKKIQERGLGGEGEGKQKQFPKQLDQTLQNILLSCLIPNQRLESPVMSAQVLPEGLH